MNYFKLFFEQISEQSVVGIKVLNKDQFLKTLSRTRT